jgi:transposase IS66 family protein
MDSNNSENALRVMGIGTKWWLFFGSDAGAATNL